MARLVTARTRRYYSRMGPRQSAKNELRGTNLHIAGAFSVFLSAILQKLPASASLRTEHLSLCLFGAALYAIVHSQDVFATHQAMRSKTFPKKGKGKSVLYAFLRSVAAFDSLIAHIYLLASVGSVLALILVNPRWASNIQEKGKFLNVFAATMFSTAATINLFFICPPPYRTRHGVYRDVFLQHISSTTFLSGSIFQLFTSVLRTESVLSECSLSDRLSSTMYIIGSSLHLMGTVANRARIRAGRRSTRFDSDSDENDSDADPEGRRSNRKPKRSRRKLGLIAWINSTTQASKETTSGERESEESHDDTSSNSALSFSSNEEAMKRAFKPASRTSRVR